MAARRPALVSTRKRPQSVPVRNRPGDSMMQSKWRVASAAAATRLFAAAFLSAAVVLSGTTGAQTAPAPAQQEYTPAVGQEGKDVIWVPTPQSLVERMLQMAGTKPTDYVVDLGSGDGRT